MASEGPVEVELKLLLPRDARPAVEEFLARRMAPAAAPETRDEHTVYFDSPRMGLARKGLSLRVRHCGGNRVQTLKSAGQPGSAAAVRGEWEWPVEADTPDVSRAAETPFGAEVAAEAEAGLEPVFETRIQRTVRTIELDGGASAEAALDEGKVSAGNASQEVSELELELKRGAPGPLYRLALDLHGAVPFVIGTESKARRGQRLRTGEAPQAVETKPPALDAEASAIQAFRRIVSAELGHFLANQPAAAIGDVEGVHQMRVGIRRLRTALALFGPHLETHASKRFEVELRRLGQVFGAARDWDVFCTEFLAEAGQDEEAKSWAALLRQPAGAERSAAHRAVEEELRRPELTGLVLGMAAWVEPDGAGQAAGQAAERVESSAALGSAKLERPLRKVAPSLLDRMARRVAKRGGRLRRRTTDELHDLRKALKKLRYAADYLAAAYPSKPAKRYGKVAKRLLKLLGAGNDAAVAAKLAERLCAAEGGRVELAPAAGALARWSEERRAKAMRKLPKAWNAFAKAPEFWS